MWPAHWDHAQVANLQEKMSKGKSLPKAQMEDDPETLEDRYLKHSKKLCA